jgi:hypothetical protein
MTMFRMAKVAAALFALLVLPAQAQPLHGAGNVLCRDFLRAGRSSDILYHQAANWILGYVSGMNAALAAKGTTAAPNLSNDQLLKSAADYCEANPSSTVASAASQWYGTLPQQAEASKEASKPAEKSGTVILNLDRPPERKFNR